MNIDFKSIIEKYLEYDYHITPDKADVKELYESVSHAAVSSLWDIWQRKITGKRACYFSAEFLTGRLIYSNLMNMGLAEDCNAFLDKYGLDPGIFEEIEDCALGNGGLGRLAACFLDSAATHSIPLDGYGIRYRYGLFRQSFENGFQRESPDDWLKWGDPWSIRREDRAELVSFASEQVLAVPYDMPVIGYGGKAVSTLRLWQAEAEPLRIFDLDSFNDQDYDKAFREKNEAEAISQVLYPNDSSTEGKKLRLKQQYFFTSASLQSILRDFREMHGGDSSASALADFCAIQLNDTHPVLSIPELLRLLIGGEHMSFDEVFPIVRDIFSYTNHTVMSEALETWDVGLFVSVLPEVYPYIIMIQNELYRELSAAGMPEEEMEPYLIISQKRIRMANLAVYASHTTNGVAAIHTEILKNSVLKQWHTIYPEKFQNKTNGITQRRWLALCNPELSELINKNIGGRWLLDLNELEKLKPLAGNPTVINEFSQVKKIKKQQLCDYIHKKEGVILNLESIFDVQVKRLHEYKRQLLNALSILDTYFSIKDGSIRDFYPMTFIFGAKAAPGYHRAKGIIKFLNEIAKLLEKDTATRDILRVVFVQNYNVSYAEKIIPAADISEQISTAGTEASGTGNMKLMLNGAVTLGTLDGANIEIVEQAGRENNYIFGADVEELTSLKESYDPMELYKKVPRIRRALDCLLTSDDGGTGIFSELHDSLLRGADWHSPDQYFLLYDFLPYCDTRLAINRDYQDAQAFGRKGFMNTASAGKFSSDRTVLEYSKDIWGL